MKKRKKAARTGAAPHGPAAPEQAEELNLRRDPLVHVLLVLAIGFAVYSNIIWAPFVFDDQPFLAGNPLIKDFGFFTDPQRVFALPVNPDLKNNFMLRPVAYFTFALNYALHGLDVGGYHVVSLLLHLVNALLVYLLVWLTLRTPVLRMEEGGEDDHPAERFYYLPLACSLLFACHPLQTQAVTYVIQRFVPLVALFYIGALVLYVAGRLAAGKASRNGLYLASLLACVLAMKTKENAFTLPVLILLYEWVFFRGAFTAPRLLRLLPFALTMAIIPVKLMQLSSVAATAQGGKVAGAVNLVNFKQVSSWEYLMTQFGVVATYLRLLLLPVEQNFDYDYPLQKTLLAPAVLLPLALLLAVAGIGAWLLYRSRGRRGAACAPLALAGFGIWWFFITLSVESSVVPIDDLIFEHRAYLPSVGFFIAAVTGIFALLPRRAGEPLGTSRPAVAALALLVTVSAGAAYARNTVWETPVSLWRDNVRKSPQKARSHFSLGVALADTLPPWHTDDVNLMLLPMDARQNEVLGEVVREFQTAARLDPQSGATYTFLGGALLVQKRYREATDALVRAAALEPRDARPTAFMGQVLEAQGDLAGARRKYQEAIAHEPSAQYAHLFLALLHLRERRHAEALAEFETAYALSPRADLIATIARLRDVAGVR
ncbi:tetratricopeptide repeat protein [Geomonas anaerohicana]|uniref:Tetratricopeptide repeat protein n=1 Tax=Geomonas anaerohicana TaxID=2798583 RepID=A0ABS0YDR0_9BACT|nr:tetratricopeptide repeat protein [Geomonas anaerohicana]MBJ6750433.1 tetratricopeptide repeat protein [Geomonas anaerohicana]